jgi:hypothetical protein
MRKAFVVTSTLLLISFVLQFRSAPQHITNDGPVRPERSIRRQYTSRT